MEPRVKPFIMGSILCKNFWDLLDGLKWFKEFTKHTGFDILLVLDYWVTPQNDCLFSKKNFFFIFLFKTKEKQRKQGNVLQRNEKKTVVLGRTQKF